MAVCKHPAAADRSFLSPPGISAVAISLGLLHTCVIVSGGRIKCWGSNSNGQLGIGSRTDATSPADVAGDSALV